MSNYLNLMECIFLDEEETKKLSKQKLKGWLFAIIDEDGNYVIPKIKHPYNLMFRNMMIEITQNKKKQKLQIRQEYANLLMKRSKK